MNPKFPLFFLFLTLIISVTFYNIQSIHASPFLNLTVTTDKPVYDPQEVVTIYGNLTQDEIPVLDGLVGIEVIDPKSQVLVIRTVRTGLVSPPVPYVRLFSVIPCNGSGGPKESFQRGEFAYFELTVKNFDSEPRTTLMTVNTYYSNNVPFCYGASKIDIEPGTIATAILCVPIPQDATLGDSKAYGNAYTDWPSAGGTPHCEEVSANFMITDSGGGGISQPTTSQVNGNYNTTFQLPPEKSGNYTVHATSDYQNEKIHQSTTFKINLPGDVNGDGMVFWQDLLAVLLAYGSKEGDPTPPWDPRCDFNHDGMVFWQDLLVILINYGKSV